MRWKCWLGVACSVACGSCIFSYDAACFDPPPDVPLLIDDARARLVERITTEGVCTVLDPPAGCDAGSCTLDSAGTHDVYRVKWQAFGKCTVTVTFSDGSAPLVQAYTFAKICPT